MDEKINRHDRVAVVSGDHIGAIGFVIAKTFYAGQERFTVNLYKDRMKKKIDTVTMFSRAELMLMQLDTTQFDLRFLIDLALDTKDFEWAQHLSKSNNSNNLWIKAGEKA